MNDSSAYWSKTYEPSTLYAGLIEYGRQSIAYKDHVVERHAPKLSLRKFEVPRDAETAKLFVLRANHSSRTVAVKLQDSVKFTDNLKIDVSRHSESCV